ncbi:unnamed protein product [Cyprideis torosa]|uniref:Ubiquitin carboxyl-terminal hydrolase 7 n=1 Tax=Cyprideis torosa TaxID=163714 RepID=A0A7R8WIR1_9CRUS|nr:unnamed protein product [Cyprideis torosa]CAG0901061.1 unnamed protein product [Cyprideis torosa]
MNEVNPPSPGSNEVDVEEMETEEGVVRVEENVVSVLDAGKEEEKTETMDADSTQAADAENEDEARSEAVFSFTVAVANVEKGSVLSPPCIVMKREAASPAQGSEKALGFFLQCNGEATGSNWSCNAQADLRLIKHNGEKPICRRITHLFYNKENDWGFSHFVSWSDLLNPAKGFLKDDSITLQVWVNADAPHGVCWDSKKHTGYVGLKNQGATCYMNSLLQVLFFTNQLRKAVYKMPTESDDSAKSVALALQRVFYELQHNDKPVGTKKLTRSFGWETLDSFMQHDVQEFLRVLLDNLECKMKGTCVEGTIPKLFEGKMLSFIRCKHVNYTSSTKEPFYDIQLNVKGKKNLMESFKDYVTVESLEGDNKYDAGEHGFQEAEKGVIFLKFPPVLHLHLMRFQYDPHTDSNVKINDRFEFPEKLNLDDFIQKENNEYLDNLPLDYTLHAVLVHSGDNHGGHYVVFINPKGEGKWCKFDDDVVARCSRSEAVECNFGGSPGEEEITLAIKHCTSAYMLVYIRDAFIKDILEEVTQVDIPCELERRFTEERELDMIRRKERSEAHLYTTVSVILEEAFEGHQGSDLFDPDNAPYRQFRVKKSCPVGEVAEMIAQALKFPLNQIRLWPIQSRSNGTSRPMFLEWHPERVVQTLSGMAPWSLFVETASPDTPAKASLKPFDKTNDLLLFFRLYDPVEARLHYCGHGYINMKRPVRSASELLGSASELLGSASELLGSASELLGSASELLGSASELLGSAGDLIATLNERAGFPPNTPLLLYEEVKVDRCDPIQNLDDSFETLGEVMDGDIIIFQKQENFPEKNYPLPTPLTYFHYRDCPAQQPISCRYEGTLLDLIGGMKITRNCKRMYYQILTCRVNEIEDKKELKVVFIDSKYREEKEVSLYPEKGASIRSVLEEAKKVFPFSENGTGKLRVLEILSSKILDTIDPEMIISHLTLSPPKVLRIEEIPPEQMLIAKDEILLACAHFHKEPLATFGCPFYIKVKHNQTLGSIKETIQKKLEISDKELEKWNFAIISAGRATFLEDDNFKLDLQKFKVHGTISVPWLGMEHLNKAPKRMRYSMEKPVKIHN